MSVSYVVYAYVLGANVVPVDCHELSYLLLHNTILAAIFCILCSFLISLWGRFINIALM